MSYFTADAFNMLAVYFENFQNPVLMEDNMPSDMPKESILVKICLDVWQYD